MRSLILLTTGLAFAIGCSSPTPPEIETSKEPFIYVRGEVRNGGKIAWTNGMTLQAAINAAGGFTDFARGKLEVIHGSVRTVYRLGPGRTFTNNPPVQPGDWIFSPWQDF